MSVTDLSQYKTFVPCRTKDNQTIVVNTQDQYIGRSIMNQGEWEPHVRNALKHLIKPEHVVMDIGANIGTHTLLMAKLAKHVIAFEPCSINHNILFMNCMVNQIYNVEIRKEGVGGEKGQMFIESRWSETGREDNYGCITLREKASDEKDVAIDIITIDSLNLQQLDVVKIDAEGMEDQIIGKGMIETIKRCKPKMIVEIHETDVKKMQPILDSIEYSLLYIGNIDFIAVHKSEVDQFVKK